MTDFVGFPKIARLNRDVVVTEKLDGSAWASFTIPADQWNPATGVKRTRNMTDEQKTAATERLRRAQVGKESTDD